MSIVLVSFCMKWCMDDLLTKLQLQAFHQKAQLKFVSFSIFYSISCCLLSVLWWFIIYKGVSYCKFSHFKNSIVNFVIFESSGHQPCRLVNGAEFLGPSPNMI